MGVGQFCTNPGVVVHEKGDVGDAFKTAYAELMGQAPASAMLHSGIRDAYGEGVTARSGSSNVEVLTDAGEGRGAGGCEASASAFATDAQSYLGDASLADEVFGPSTLLVACEGREEMLEIAGGLEGQLTASIFGSAEELADYQNLVDVLETKVGRLLFNQFPTGVEVCHSMVHGGPYPATTDGRSTSVGTGAILRFARPVCYQGFPAERLPEELKDENPLGIKRVVDGERG
jgi:NADP-dependent aldehyde dehydrogenase